MHLLYGQDMDREENEGFTKYSHNVYDLRHFVNLLKFPNCLHADIDQNTSRIHIQKEKDNDR